MQYRIACRGGEVGTACQSTEPEAQSSRSELGIWDIIIDGREGEARLNVNEDVFFREFENDSRQSVIIFY